MANNHKIDATRDHIDAETMAAWAERGLPAETAAAVELHLSNCERCQEVLAAFVRSEPAPAAVILPFWNRRPVQWSAAGLAAAAAIVAMVWIGRPSSVALPETTVARTPIDAISPLPSQAVQPSPSPELSREALSSQVSRSSQPRPSQQVARKAVVGEQAPAKPSSAVGASQLQAVAAPPPPPAQAAVAVPPPPPPSVTVGAASAVVPPASAALPVTISEQFLRDAAALVPTFEVLSPDPVAARRNLSADASRGGGGGGGGAGAGRGGGRGGQTESTISARWRVTGGNRIERSADAGGTWVALTLEPALATPLMAGASPSPLVCWFVGADGVVLVSTDGRTLRRVSLPESIVLTAVTAVDGLRATVTAIDGRKFSTVDGGMTWK